MHLQTVRLQRVFDVKRDPISKIEATYFSFETTDGQRCLSVQLPGRPRLEVGDEVAAVLASAGNWQTLRGWKNLSSGEIVVRGQLGVAGVLRTGAAVVAILATRPTTDAGRTIAAVALGGCGVLAVLLARQQWQAWRVRRLLETA